MINSLTKKEKTTNHLYINHPKILFFFKASFYNYINNSVFEFGPLDFPRIGKQKEKHEMIVNENVAIELFKIK